MITPFTSNDKVKDKQLQQNAERNRDTGEKSKETSLINRKITNQLAGLSIDGKMVGFAMPVSCQHPDRKEISYMVCQHSRLVKVRLKFRKGRRQRNKMSIKSVRYAFECCQ